MSVAELTRIVGDRRVDIGSCLPSRRGAVDLASLLLGLYDSRVPRDVIRHRPFDGEPFLTVVSHDKDERFDVARSSHRFSPCFGKIP